GNPWDVDGIISTNTADPDNNNSSPRPSADDKVPYRGLVWGCERPELLLTETLAFHDRRVADTAGEGSAGHKRTDKNDDDPPAPADEDLDQPRIPQGSAFFELYCPRSPTTAAAPLELYYRVQSQWALDLGRMAPADPADPNPCRYPVWRLVITESHSEAQNNVLARLLERPHSSSLEPEQFADANQSLEPSLNRGAFSLLKNPTRADQAANVEIERIVWFASERPYGIDQNRIYWHQSKSPPPPLLAGGYAVVGPRAETFIGSKVFSANADIGEPSQHRIRLNQMGVIDNDGTNHYPTPGQIKSPVTIFSAANQPPDWPQDSAAGRNGIGISISEPLPFENYYPEPDVRRGSGPTEWYGDPDNLSGPEGGFLDEPQDRRAGRPLQEDGMLQTGTRVNYKTVFLQRLANPLQPYDPLANPYRTVDWMPIDLTVFNGEDTSPDWPPGWAPQGSDETFAGGWDPDDPAPDTTPPVAFQARQRGGLPAMYGPYNLWAQTSRNPEETDPSGPNDNNFRHGLVGNRGHTLGYINRWFHQNPAAPPDARGWLTVPPTYCGDPVQPFPWLTWNNRPFVSQLELLLVPTSHPGRLLMEYRFPLAADSPKPYEPNAATPREVPYPHLLNFFHSGRSGVDPPNSPQLHRLLEYVHVPSRFVGTELQGNPTVFAASGGHSFRPPFNWISRYREPGRVNINTIFSRAVWEGVMNYFPNMTPAPAGPPGPVYWQEMVQSRRGYPAVGGLADPDGVAALDPSGTYPTRFGRPFRSFAGGEMVPLDDLKPDREIDATLLRADPTEPTRPLFRFDATIAGSYPAVAQVPGEFNNTDRSPYFRYQGLQRLGNLVTTRSNVYAIWITVGYFEVEPVTSANFQSLKPELATWPQAQVQAVYPDGYAL
ncbi:MAG: hypothetical protein ACYSWU_20760, partial [Planctomycetota bacterium]